MPETSLPIQVPSEDPKKKKEEKEKIGNLASQTDAEEKRSKRILGVREQENGVASN